MHELEAPGSKRTEVGTKLTGSVPRMTSEVLSVSSVEIWFTRPRFSEVDGLAVETFGGGLARTVGFPLAWGEAFWLTGHSRESCPGWPHLKQAPKIVHGAGLFGGAGGQGGTRDGLCGLFWWIKLLGIQIMRF